MRVREGTLAEQAAVVRPPLGELGDVVRCQPLERGLGTLTPDAKLTHVRHIEEAGSGSNRPMLVDNA